jgi:hypothetical protein
LLCVSAAGALGQYKLESAGAPPQELAPAIGQALQKDGAKIVAADGSVFAEIWLRTEAPKGSTSEQNVSLSDMSHGVLLGAIRFPQEGKDRRGQAIKPGVYTLRLSFYPVDGSHQGISITRDFLLMVPAEIDKDLNSTPSYKELVDLSKKASGTTHPAVLNAWKGESAGSPSLEQEGEDWVLKSTLGEVPISIIVVGTFVG